MANNLEVGIRLNDKLTQPLDKILKRIERLKEATRKLSSFRAQSKKSVKETTDKLTGGDGIGTGAATAPAEPFKKIEATIPTLIQKLDGVVAKNKTVRSSLDKVASAQGWATRQASEVSAFASKLGTLARNSGIAKESLGAFQSASKKLNTFTQHSKKAQKAMRVLQSTSGGFQQMGKGLLSVAKSIFKVDGAAHSASKRVSKLVTELKKATGRKLGEMVPSAGKMALGIAGAAAAIGYAGYQLFDQVSSLEAVSKGFEVVTGSAEKAKAALKESDALALKFGMSTLDTRKEMLKFLGLGFDQGQSSALLKMGGDMRALGLEAEQIQGIMGQLGQIKSKGKLQGEELVVLAENGLSSDKVYARLEKRLGKTREEVMKLQSTGGIGSSDALNAIAESLLDTFGKEINAANLGSTGAQMADETLSGMMGKMKAKIGNGLASLVPKLKPSFGRLLSVVDNVFTKLGPLVEKYLPVILDVVSRIAEMVGNKLGSMIEWLDKATVGFNADNFGDGFVAGAEKVIEALVSIAELAKALLPIFKTINRMFGSSDDIMQVVHRNKLRKELAGRSSPGVWNGNPFAESNQSHAMANSGRAYGDSGTSANSQGVDTFSSRTPAGVQAKNYFANAPVVNISTNAPVTPALMSQVFR